MQKEFINRFARKIGALTIAACMAFSLAACSSDSSSDSKKSDSSKTSQSTQADTMTLSKMTGISATGELGQKPKVTFKTPFSVTNNSYQILQKGNGEELKDGMQVCSQQITLNATTGAEVQSTWESGPECSIRIDANQLSSAYYKLFKGQKLGTTIAFGLNAAQTAGSNAQTTTADQYINVLTFVSVLKTLERATGTPVTDIPSNLPKVTLDKNGKPSLDLNGYKPEDKLVVQPLIQGDGDTVGENDSVTVHYTGWLASDGKQFDSSWDRGTSTSFSLNQVVAGWKQGLAGQKVGSQVLLIVPPSLGYGSQGQGTIPGNATLIFVVDILAKY
ncbi:FKBP-type peptidyl-prolyl cis-trans isomerase [Galliscardovia ingluviei]|nr:FKBP-type peptidyl-prolyl cis-trans isomerase [Galliscardovia ingluviei]